MEVPPATHPCWIALLRGKGQPPAFMGARMLIVRCRMALVKNNNNPDKLHKYAAQLRELYVNNADSPSANQDLATLLEEAGARVTHSDSSRR